MPALQAAILFPIGQTILTQPRQSGTTKDLNIYAKPNHVNFQLGDITNVTYRTLLQKSNSRNYLRLL